MSGAPIVANSAALSTPDVLSIGTTISIASGCPPVPVTLKGTKKGTKVKAKWASCPGFSGGAKLVGKIPLGCATFSGVFRAKKAKIKRTVTAARSSCGDGVFDPTSETCEGTNGCAGAQVCQNDCTCGGPGGTCGPGAPQARFAHGGTLQAGQPVTFDGGTSTDPDGDALVWSWSFDDGQRAGGAQVAHVYATAGPRSVRLTVGDGCGHTATTEQTLDVIAGPAPTGTTQATGKIRNLAGAAVAGALVTAVPGGTATSNASGDVTITVGQDVPVRITVAKAGYADQAILTEVPNLPLPNAYFEATLIAREPGQTLADAAAGGTIAGKHGAVVVLPPGGLVDDAGNPIGGAVDVFVTPVNVTTDIEAFPGRASGVAPDGTQSPIVTYGTVEYALEQNGEPLNVTPGALATIEIPVYATKNLDGGPLAVGDVFPLWSFDPTTAQWVQEGQGTVVQSSGSPTGFALRGQVTHFSWWNHDLGVPAYKPKPKCLVDTNADGILEDLTGTGHCWHGGTGPEQPDDGFSLATRTRGPRAAVETPRFPNWLGQEVLPAAGGKILQVPSEMDIVLRSHAKGGTLRGTKMIRGAANVEEDVIVVLAPVDVNNEHITIPFEAVRTLSPADSLHVFDFDGTAGQTVFVTVDEPGQSSASADVSILLPGEGELGPVEYRPIVNRAGLIGLVLPTAGNYRITVILVGSTGSYHIKVGYTGDFPIILSTSPAGGATGVATTTAPAVTFSLNVAPGFTFDLHQADSPVTGTQNTVGSVSTFTPAAPLIPGAAYVATVDAFRTPGSQFPNGFPRTYEWVLNAAETLGTIVPIGFDDRAVVSAAADHVGNVYVTWQTSAPSPNSHRTYAARYAPGVGWTPPTNLRGAGTSFVGSAYGTTIAAVPGGAVAVWPDPSTGGQVSMYESRYTPALGWGPATLIENGPGLFRQPPALAADAAGNLIALSGTDGVNDYKIYSHRFTAGGAWAEPELLFADALDAELAMAASGRAIAMARRRNTNDVLVRLFVPGQGWGTLSTFESNVQGESGAIDDAGNAFLLVVTGSQHLVRRFDTTTLVWSDPLNLQSSVLCAEYARVTAAADGHAFVSGCTNTAPGPGVFAARYTPGVGGGSWGASELLHAGNQWRAMDLGFDDSGNAVAMWLPPADGTMGHYKRFSVATGWEATVHDFVGPAGAAYPHLAVGGNGVAMVLTTTLTTQKVVGIRLP